MSAYRRTFDADWLEFDDARRFYVGADGMRHIPAGVNARCGVGPLAVVLRPEEEIEFRCSNCWPSSAGTCATCGKRVQKRYGGEGRYLPECIDCWTAPKGRDSQEPTT